MNELSIRRPDDWHLHLRDGTAMADVVALSAAGFARAIVMPNLHPPVVSVGMAAQYRRRIVAALADGCVFQPLMTLYLTDLTRAEEIRAASASGLVQAVKLYPAGATTNSEHGVTDLGRVHGALQAMAEVGLPLLVHGEVTDPEVDIFDREKVFIDRILGPLVEQYPRLKVVLEHVTTADGVDFVLAAREGVAATVTPHHLLLGRNAIFAGGLNPHHYCLPVLKRERHRRALVEAVISGSPRFFAGTDSAPHAAAAKECAHGCAGVFNAHAAVPLYAEVFEHADALDRLEPFLSINGAEFYGMPVNEERVTLAREPWSVPTTYSFGDARVVPLHAGEEVAWKVL